MNDQRRCTIIILSKTVELLARSLASIAEAHETDSFWNVLVIDDGLAERPKGMRNIEYLSGIKPFCFARNVNLGIRHAGEASDVFLLNDDAFFVTRNGLPALREAVSENPRLGVVTPVFARVERTPSQRLGRLNPANGLWIERDAYLTFAGAYLRRELIDEIGGLDESFTGYGYEDNDYCLRAVLAGYELGVLPTVVMGHGDEHGSASLTFRSVSDMRSNLDRYVLKWMEKLFGVGEDQRDQLIRFLKFI